MVNKILGFSVIPGTKIEHHKQKHLLVIFAIFMVVAVAIISIIWFAVPSSGDENELPISEVDEALLFKSVNTNTSKVTKSSTSTTQINTPGLLPFKSTLADPISTTKNAKTSNTTGSGVTTGTVSVPAVSDAKKDAILKMLNTK